MEHDGAIEQLVVGLHGHADGCQHINVGRFRKYCAYRIFRAVQKASLVE
jgi:phage replication-related protein YjqB (UPF0714/DUF867 family)